MCLLCLVDQLGLVIPQLLLGLAGDLRDNELDLLVHQLALLPGDGLAALLACPHLVTLRVLLPESDAVLLGHIPTLGHLHHSHCDQSTVASPCHTHSDPQPAQVFSKFNSKFNILINFGKSVL